MSAFSQILTNHVVGSVVAGALFVGGVAVVGTNYVDQLPETRDAEQQTAERRAVADARLDRLQHCLDALDAADGALFEYHDHLAARRDGDRPSRALDVEHQRSEIGHYATYVDLAETCRGGAR